MKRCDFELILCCAGWVYTCFVRSGPYIQLNDRTGASRCSRAFSLYSAFSVLDIAAAAFRYLRRTVVVSAVNIGPRPCGTANKYAFSHGRITTILRTTP